MSVIERIGNYLLYPAIAAGGMATVHTARVAFDGMHRLVAIKRLHPELSDDPEFVTMFRDEARIASLIRHPNVVPVFDVVDTGAELLLVQEYVHGVPLSHLLKRANANEEPIPTHVALAIVCGVLAGLHAAHEVVGDDGRPLEIVHRDVSPQNIIVGVDGVPRLLDFGIAKARTSTHRTKEGIFKGKLAYMAPEQLRMDGLDRTADVYAIGVLLWEMLVNRRIFDGRHELGFVSAVLCGEIPRVVAALADTRETVPEVRLDSLAILEPIVATAMSLDRRERHATAEAMRRAITASDVPVASTREIAGWVKQAGDEYLERRERTLAENEEKWRTTPVRATTIGRGLSAPLPPLPRPPVNLPRPSLPRPSLPRPNLPRPTTPTSPSRVAPLATSAVVPRANAQVRTVEPPPLPRPSPLTPLAITEPPPPPPALGITPMKMLDIAPPSLSPLVPPDEGTPRSRRRPPRDAPSMTPWLVVSALVVITAAVAGVTTASRRPRPHGDLAPAPEHVLPAPAASPSATPSASALRSATPALPSSIRAGGQR
ncbi:MAG: serine/threonine protein kinase [Deltaproteobacteria bacterium]|nr:serine/threonine protein kinase [Deltaproteobacteria bacterium]